MPLAGTNEQAGLSPGGSLDRTRSAAGSAGSDPPAAMAVAKGLAAGIVAAVIFAGGAVVSRLLVSDGYAPIELTLVRYIGCFPVALLALAIAPARLGLDLSWPRLIVLLAVGGPPYHALLLSGYAHATSGAGALLVTGLVPVLGLIVAWTLSREVPRWQALVGAGLVLSGLMLFGGLAAAAAFTPAGALLFAAAALAWAVLNQLVRIWEVDPLRLTIALAVWAPLFLPFYFYAHPAGLAEIAPSAGLALQLLYHGLLVAFGATLLFFAAIRWAGAHRTAALLALVPPFAALLGAALLGEVLSAGEALGAAVAVCGIALTMVYAPPARDGRTIAD